MKQLTQAVFKDAPDWVKSAAVNADGSVYWYSCKASYMFTTSDVFDIAFSGVIMGFVGSGYDTTNWQNSAIDREFN